MKIKAARICLFFASLLFVFGILLLCHCPGLFGVAALLALVSTLAGNGLVRVVGIAVCAACLVGTFQSYQAKQRQQQRMRNIQTPGPEAMHQLYSPLAPTCSSLR